jgi:hypothetical protein
MRRRQEAEDSSYVNRKWKLATDIETLVKTEPIRAPAQTSSVPRSPPLKKIGVENFQSGFHVPSVAAHTPPPAEATAPIINCKKIDWEMFGFGWEAIRLRDPITAPIRRIASGRKRRVSKYLGINNYVRGLVTCRE